MPVWKPRPTHHEEKESTVRERGTPRGDADILLHVMCILLIMTFPIVQMVSCWGPPQNTGPQAIACLACPIATPLLGSSFCQCDKKELHSLWSSPKCLNRLCLTVFSSLWSSLLLVHIFYPISFFQSTLHLICFDTALLEQPPPPPFSNAPLWLTLFVEVLMIVFWTVAKSAVFPIIVLSKNKIYPQFIQYGWSFIETQI